LRILAIQKNKFHEVNYITDSYFQTGSNRQKVLLFVLLLGVVPVGVFVSEIAHAFVFCTNFFEIEFISMIRFAQIIAKVYDKINNFRKHCFNQ
jgi:hypothetical protein